MTEHIRGSAEVSVRLSALFYFFFFCIVPRAIEKNEQLQLSIPRKNSISLCNDRIRVKVKMVNTISIVE